MPLAAKLLAAAIAPDRFSLIDLVPDAIPVLGLLGEAILLPLVLPMRRLIPPPLSEDLRSQAAETAERPGSRMGTAVMRWDVAAMLGVWWLASAWAGGG